MVLSQPLFPVPNSWNLVLLVGELGRQVTVDDTTQDFETRLVVAQAVILLRDITELKKEDGVKAYRLLVM